MLFVIKLMFSAVKITGFSPDIGLTISKGGLILFDINCVFDFMGHDDSSSMTHGP